MQRCAAVGNMAIQEAEGVQSAEVRESTQEGLGGEHVIDACVPCRARGKQRLQALHPSMGGCIMQGSQAPGD